MVKVRKKQKTNDVCEMSLLIEKDEQIVEWDNEDLVKSIMDEVEIAEGTAREIAEKVRNKTKELCDTMGWESASSDLIREMVVNEIVSKGKKYRNKIEKYSLIGLSSHEIKAIVENTEGGENSNITTNNPEAINFTITEIVQRKYALQEVFSKEVVKSHLNGNISLHDTSQPAKYYCGSHSIQYVIKNGLKLPTIKTQSAPPRYASTLTGVVATYLCTVSQIYAGALGLADVNNAYAPFLVGLTDKQIYQVCQEIAFSLAQTAMGRGSQALFIDLNLNIATPEYLKNAKAIGPCGKYYKLTRSEGRDVIVECEKKEASTYEEYEEYSTRFLVQLMKVLEEGDKNGLTFSFPKANVHFNEECFLEKYDNVRRSVFSCASKNGGIYFLFDRNGESSVSQCCRLKTNLSEEQLEELNNSPENSRFTALQNVSISLPSAYLEAREELGENAKKEDLYSKTIDNMKKFMDIAVIAHKEKLKYIKHLYNLHNGPLNYAKKGMDGKPYVDNNKLTYLIGIIGLDNTIFGITGKHLHENNEAFKMGLSIIANMRIYCDELKEKTGLKLSLEETPAESAAGRLAKISMKRFGENAAKIACASETNDPYWNNSIHYDYSADVPFLKRIIDQSKFHSMIDAGSIVHCFCSENLPPEESIENLVKKVLFKTKCSQFTISPEFTVCSDCDNVELGIHEKCYKCDSTNIDCLTRVVGYNSWVSRWTKSKKEELIRRNKTVGF